MKISEILTDKYKLRIPPTVYYELLADVQEAEEEQKQKMGQWIEGRKEVYKCSACGNYALEWGGKLLASSYCPWCGAKMEESGGTE